MNILITILIIYFLIGIFRALLLFLQPFHNRPIAVANLQLKYILISIVFWLPLVILRIKEVGIKTFWRWEIKTIKNIFTK